MHQSMFYALSALAVALPISALKPIALRDFDSFRGIERRDADFSSLDAQTQQELIYGGPNDDNLVLANMTLYADNGLEIVLMERFDDLTSAVDCKGDDGEMSLTFSSQSAYDYAKQQWGNILGATHGNGSFLLIANNKGCGPDDERQPYIISQLTEDDATHTTHLKSAISKWEDIAGTYDLDFGQYTGFQQHSKRSIVDSAKGNTDWSKPFSIDVNAGTKDKKSNIFTSDTFTLDCIECYTTGKFQFTGHISTKNFKPSAVSLSASPQDFTSVMELEATIKASKDPVKLQKNWQLISTPVPDLGLSVNGIFDLGAVMSYSVGLTSSFAGQAVVDFGLSASIPDAATMNADIMAKDKSSAKGWDGGKLDPLFDVKSLEASVSLGAYSTPMLSLEVDLKSVGKIGVDISVKLPEVTSTLTAAYNKDGVCDGNKEVTGVKLDNQVDISVDLGVTAKAGKIDGVPDYNANLYKWNHDLPSKCFPVKIPGLVPASASASSNPKTDAPATVSHLDTITTHAALSTAASGKPIAPIVNGTSIIIQPSAVAPGSVTSKATQATNTHTGHVVGPTGIISSDTGAEASGTGSKPSGTAAPPKPSSSSGTGSSPSTLSTATGTGAKPSASVHSTTLPGSPSPSVYTEAPLFPTVLPVTKRDAAATGTDGCHEVKKFGRRMLIC